MNRTLSESPSLLHSDKHTAHDRLRVGGESEFPAPSPRRPISGRIAHSDATRSELPVSPRLHRAGQAFSARPFLPPRSRIESSRCSLWGATREQKGSSSSFRPEPPCSGYGARTSCSATPSEEPTLLSADRVALLPAGQGLWH